MTTANLSTAEKRVALRWIPQGSREIKHELGVCYVQEHVNQATGRETFSVMAFAGTARKPAFYNSYRTREARDAQVSQFFTGLEGHATRVQERKAERNKPHTLTVGDIIYNSWGWEQTNIDWYVIVKKTSNYVWLQPIAAEQLPAPGCSPMSGYTQPVLPVRQIIEREVRDYDQPGYVLVKHPIEPKMHRAEGQNVCFKHGCGCVWDGRPKYESWYA